jgi:hypothetical protein
MAAAMPRGLARLAADQVLFSAMRLDQIKNRQISCFILPRIITIDFSVYLFRHVRYHLIIYQKLKKAGEDCVKTDTIRTSSNYCCVPGKLEPAFAGLADLQDAPLKRHGLRVFIHAAPGAGVTRRSMVQPCCKTNHSFGEPMEVIDSNVDMDEAVLNSQFTNISIRWRC